MRKVGIVLIVCLLAVAGITAAMAYTSAEVESDVAINVTSTDVALLAMLEGDHDEATSIEYGKLQITPGVGLGGHMFGFQNDSKYCFVKLFEVKNNAEFWIDATLELSTNLQQLADWGVLEIVIDNPYGAGGPQNWADGSVRAITPAGHAAGAVRSVDFCFDLYKMSDSTWETWEAMDLSQEWIKVNAVPQ